MSTPDRPTIDRTDLEAALAARRELGEEMEPAVLESFLEKIDRGIDGRIDARLASHRGRHGGAARHGSELALAIVSVILGAGIASSASLAVVIAAWIGIVLVNAVYTLRR
jgi:hypothetical protein